MLQKHTMKAVITVPKKYNEIKNKSKQDSGPEMTILVSEFLHVAVVKIIFREKEKQ